MSHAPRRTERAGVGRPVDGSQTASGNRPTCPS
jgi:hypothetical protein